MQILASPVHRLTRRLQTAAGAVASNTFDSYWRGRTPIMPDRRAEVDNYVCHIKSLLEGLTIRDPNERQF